MKADGPPGASSNGFNENLALFKTASAACGSTPRSPARFVTDPKQSKVADKVGFALAPEQRAWQERQLALGVVAGRSGRNEQGRSG